MPISPVIIVGIAIILLFGVGLGHYGMMAYYHLREHDDLEWLSNGQIANRATLVIVHFICLVFIVGGFWVIDLSAVL
ncbi:MAG: hypothetical protein ACTTH3_05345 [Schwartzia sp. (in: firmicutes)]|mgnify:CR=1